MRIALDVGANIGQNLEYFKGTVDRVVAIEANPELCKEIRDKFSKDIQNDLIRVINCAVVKHGSLDHKAGRTQLFAPRDIKRSVLGSLLPPPQKNEDFVAIEVPTLSIVDIIKKEISDSDVFSFCKIDLEGYDELVLEDLLDHHSLPEVVSFECHSRRPLELIFDSGIYTGFKLIEGTNVGRRLVSTRSVSNKHSGQEVVHKFAIHSSGPWGEDVPGPWLSRRALALYIFLAGTGWKDVQASHILSHEPSFFSKLYFKLAIRQLLLRIRSSLRIRTRFTSFLK